MHVSIGRLLAVILLTLCVGVQVLEATGRWDRTIQDTGDEAVIVTAVLCIGAALCVASAVRQRFRTAPAPTPTPVRKAIFSFDVPRPLTFAALCAGPPPLSLRI